MTQEKINLETGEVQTGVPRKQFTPRKAKKRTHYSYVPNVGQKFKMPSQTTPDQSMSIREIMNKYAKGLVPAINKDGKYGDVSSNSDNFLQEGLDFKKMDLIDLQQLTLKAQRLKHDAEKAVKLKYQEAKETELQKLREQIEAETFEKIKNAEKEQQKTH